MQADEHRRAASASAGSYARLGTHRSNVHESPFGEGLLRLQSIKREPKVTLVVRFGATFPRKHSCGLIAEVTAEAR
jgi:hypothetical protein